MDLSIFQNLFRSIEKASRDANARSIGEQLGLSEKEYQMLVNTGTVPNKSGMEKVFNSTVVLNLNGKSFDEKNFIQQINFLLPLLLEESFSDITIESITDITEV